MLTYIALIFICAVQSIFGIGVLLFGTPIFILMGYSFINSLCILLPLSLFINFLQLLGNIRHVDLNFLSKVFLITLPIIFMILYFIAKIDINLSFIIGIILILYSLRYFVSTINEIFMKFLKLRYLPYVLMGVLHGGSNLGGSLLTMLVQSEINQKRSVRASIAISYGAFAIVQISALLYADIKFDLNIKYFLLGCGVYFLVNKFIFQTIDEDFYQKIFNMLIFVFGMILVIW